MRLRNKPWAEPFLEENDDLVLKYSEELKDNKYVYTESVGEEPNRCLVIKAKEDK